MIVLYSKKGNTKSLMYETYYDKLQPYFGHENIQLCYMDTDSFVISINNKTFSKT